MKWIHTITIIASLGGFSFWLFNKLHNRIKDIGNRLDSHAMQIDEHYKVFLDLLKEKK